VTRSGCFGIRSGWSNVGDSLDEKESSIVQIIDPDIMNLWEHCAERV